jgi:hypothetical protein
MSKIHIDIRDGIPQELAVEKVLKVIKQGRISKDDTIYCHLTVFEDGIHVAVNDYRKSDCFIVYKSKRK